MIFNIPLGMRTTTTVSVYGAPNKVVELYGDFGAEDGSGNLGVTMDENGYGGELTIPTGEYIVVCQDDDINFSKNITVTANTKTVTGYPDGALYWYGLEIVPFSFVTQDGTSGYFGKDTNRILMGHTEENYPPIALAVMSDNVIDFSGYNTLKFTSYAYQDGMYAYNGVFKDRDINYTDFRSGDEFSVRGSKLVRTSELDPDFVQAIDISSVGSGYVGAGFANKVSEVYYPTMEIRAIWLDDDSSGEEVEETVHETAPVSIPINSTFRHCNALYTSSFVTVGSLGGSLKGINYVGEGTQDYNAMMVPVPAFSFPGKGLRLKLSLYLWCSSSSNHTFRWAVTTSRANENLYKSYGDVEDEYQLGAGAFTPSYNYGNYAYQTFTLDCDNIPSDKPLYIYLWRDNKKYGNIHVMKPVTVALQYLA